MGSTLGRRASARRLDRRVAAAASGKPLYRYVHPLLRAPFVVVGD
jgi:hypothetical protein